MNNFTLCHYELRKSAYSCALIQRGLAASADTQVPFFFTQTERSVPFAVEGRAQQRQ